MNRQQQTGPASAQPSAPPPPSGHSTQFPITQERLRWSDNPIRWILLIVIVIAVLFALIGAASL